MTIPPLRREALLPRIDGITKNLKRLREFGARPRKEFLENEDLFDLAQHHLRLALEGVFHIASHILSRIPGTRATGYREIALALGVADIVDRTFAEGALVKMAGYPTVAFVTLDPGKLLAGGRDATRWNDVNAIRQAEELYRTDEGVFLPEVQTLIPSTNYMIGTAGEATVERIAGEGCDVYIGAGNGVAIGGLTPKYLANIPIAPKASGGVAWSSAETRYYLRKSATGAFLVIGACDAEATTRISTATSGTNKQPQVSPITSNTPDADVATPGIQYLEGTTVTYSSTPAPSDPDGDLLTWDWVYSLNGTPEVTYFSGVGALQNLVYPYGAGEAGNTYQWFLRVSDGQQMTPSTFTNTIVSSDQIVDSGLGGPGDFTGGSPKKGLGAGAGYVGDFVPAKIGNGLRVDAAGEYGRYRQTDGTTKNVERDKGSAEFWYHPFAAHTNGVRHPLFSTGTWGSAGSLHLVKEDTAGGNDLVVYFYNGAGVLSIVNRISSANYGFSANVWTHVRVTWDFTVSAGVRNIRVYLDGKETPLETGFSTGTVAMGAEDPAQYIWIGSRDGGAENGNGIFDELKIYVVPIAGTDAIKPSQPRSVALTAPSASQVTLSWTASVDNRKVQDYRVYRCEGVGCTPTIPVGLPSVIPSFSDTVPSPGSFYRYAVTARDIQGNESAFSIVKGVNTSQSGIPNAPPVVSDITASEPDVDLVTPNTQYYQNTSATYSATASDPNNDPLTWEWKYTVNGGPEVPFTNGTGVVQTTPSFPYGPSTLGYTYVWILRVSDGQATPVQKTLTVQIINQAPSVSLTAPANNTTVTAGTNVSITATASDDAGVSGVQFLLDGANLGAEDTIAPYTASWNTTGAAVGTHTLTARARDAQGVQTTSGGVGVTVNAPSDTTPPAQIITLAASNPTSNSILLSWPAPGDDGSVGTATSYDIRYSTTLITTANWASATTVTGEPAPALAGTNQTYTVTGLSPSTLYYFAMITSDEVPNVSALSNVVSGTTGVFVAGGAPLRAGQPYAEATKCANPNVIFCEDFNYSQNFSCTGSYPFNDMWLNPGLAVQSMSFNYGCDGRRINLATTYPAKPDGAKPSGTQPDSVWAANWDPTKGAQSNGATWGHMRLSGQNYANGTAPAKELYFRFQAYWTPNYTWPGDPKVDKYGYGVYPCYDNKILYLFSPEGAGSPTDAGYDAGFATGCGTYEPSQNARFADALQVKFGNGSGPSFPMDSFSNTHMEYAPFQSLTLRDPHDQPIFGRIFRFDTNRWYTLELRYKLSSSPGVKDGVIEVWIDGNKIYSANDLATCASGLGNCNEIGSIFLGDYHNGSDPTVWNGQQVIDNLIVSRSYIGPPQ